MPEDEVSKAEKRNAEIENIAFYSEHFFSRLLDRTPADQMNDAAKICDAIAEMLDRPYELGDRERMILRRFESIYLWIVDRLTVAQASVLQQVQSITQSSELCEVVGALATLDDRQVRRLVRLTQTDIISRMSFWMISGFYGLTLPRMQRRYLTRDNLFQAKVGMQRLAQVVRYGSSLEVAEDHEVIGGTEDHFDPTKISVQKLQSLLARARIQVKSVQDIGIQLRIEARLDRIENELKKPIIRWSIVIAAAFTLFGFLADLKSLDGAAYDDLANTVKEILSVVHHDGQVHARQNGVQPLLFDATIKQRRDHIPRRDYPQRADVISENKEVEIEDDEDDLDG